MDSGIIELHVYKDSLHGIVGEKIVVETKAELMKGSVLLVDVASLESSQLTSADYINLSPSILCDNQKVFFYQGRRSKTFKYLSMCGSDDLKNNIAENDFRSSYEMLFVLQESTAKPTIPTWAQRNDCEYLCPGLFSDRKENPVGFYRGARPAWADIRGGIALKRHLKIDNQTYDVDEYLINKEPEWHTSSLQYEAPCINNNWCWWIWKNNSVAQSCL